MRIALALLLCLIHFPTQAGSTHRDPGEPRQMVITFDDLPWTSLSQDVPADLADYHQRLMGVIGQAQIPVTGFVNESKLEIDGEVQPERLAMLTDWLDLGAELGNHTYAHLDLHRVGLEAYQQDILRGEQQLRPLLASRGMLPKWFRHPYLRAGQSQQIKQALADFLAEHGYRIAPVTVDNSEWIWALAYRRAREQGEDEALLSKLRTDYVNYMLEKIVYYEQQSVALFKREIPQVLLLHANEINADSFAELIDDIRQGGYRIVDLETALADPVYQTQDGYYGQYGPSWIHRWAMAKGQPREFFGEEPLTPQWVLDLAQVESE